MTTVKLHDILWRTKNAGASPDDNRRTELYFAGCQKALSGNPCKDCFNPALWDNKNHIPHNVSEIVDALDLHKIPKHITIVGGEPTDQKEGLIELIDLLYKRGYETIMFTWRSPFWIRVNIGVSTLKKLAYTICGPYEEEHRIYDTSRDDGIHNAIGSDNQIIVRYAGHGVFETIPVSKLDRVIYQDGKPVFCRKESES